MSKRFTDTDKWTQNKWFRKLSTKYKLFWMYLLDCCDNVGVWEEDIELASYLISEPLDKEDLLKIFSEQIKIIKGGKKWWIKKFIEYQYGVLDINNTKNRPHQSFIKTLMRHSLWIDYQETIHRPKEKDKDKEKEEDKEKRLLREKQFEKIYKEYPNRDSKKKAKEHFIASVKADKDWQDINTALVKYKKHLTIEDWLRPKSASTWFNNWKDWINYVELVKHNKSQQSNYAKIDRDSDKYDNIEKIIL